MSVLRRYSEHFKLVGQTLYISDAVLGILSGSSFTTPLTVTIAAAASPAINTLATLIARRSSSTVAGFGAALVFQLDDSANVVQDATRVAGVWTSATTGLVSSAITFAVRDGGAAITERMRLTNTGQLFVGTGGAPEACAKFQVDSTTRGVLDPRMTTTQRDAISSLTEGLRVWNLTKHTEDIYDGTSWTSLGNVVYSTSTGEMLLGVSTAMGVPGVGFRYDMGLYGYTQAGVLREILTWDFSNATGNIITLGNSGVGTAFKQKTATRANGGGHFWYGGVSTTIQELDNVRKCIKVPTLITTSTSTGDPDATSILDLVSTALGVLFPRMTTTQRLAITSPGNSLTVYDLTLNKLFQYRNGAWTFVGDYPTLIGVSGSTASYYGAMNAADVETIAGNVIASATKFYHKIDTSADRTVSLPSAAGVDDHHIFRDYTGNALVHNVIFNVEGGGTVNGNSTYTESVPYFGRTAVKIGSTTWQITQ